MYVSFLRTMRVGMIGIFLKVCKIFLLDESQRFSQTKMEIFFNFELLVIFTTPFCKKCQNGIFYDVQGR